ncbi:MAG: vitamin K epoxide reductase family protein, partial [Planctomycetota bacterium]|nr:vitamin K epoxide reductase family protein [Planctomycetota bacterium]
MLFARRLTAIRVTTLVAVLASVILVADHVRPGREFCPLEEACSAAAHSELGTLFGVPTSMLGLAAFAAVLMMTLLPVRVARKLLQPACFVGAMSAMAFIAYQAMYLDAFCPLCLVADGAAIVMAYLALTWPPLPSLRTGRPLSAETGTARAAWALALVLTVLAPFAWPREEDPGWEDAPVPAAELFGDGADLATAPAPESAPAATVEPATVARAVDLPAPAKPTVVEAARPRPVPEAILATPTHTPEPEPAQDPQPTPPHAEPVAPAAATPAPTPPTPPKPTGVPVIEYLNAFCAHCRATHTRLETVLAHDGTNVRRRRVYTWKGSGYPLWARACAYAETIGREDAMFRELTRARRERPQEVYAAAKRAGIDGPAFRQALLVREPPARLVRDQRISKAARLKRLPTFDI